MAESKLALGGGGIDQSSQGIEYQKIYLMLFACCGFQRKLDFKLYTEILDAEKFDDLVFRYKMANEKKIKIRFLQAKHKIKPNEMDLVTLLIDKDFRLDKYFISFVKIIKFFHDEDIEDVILATNNFFESTGNDIIKIKDKKHAYSGLITLEKIECPDLCLNGLNFRYKFVKSHQNFNFVKNYLISSDFMRCIFIGNLNEISVENFPILIYYQKFVETNIIDKATMKIQSNFIHGYCDPHLKEFREIFSTTFTKFISNNYTWRQKFNKSGQKDVWGFLKSDDGKILANVFKLYESLDNQKNDEKEIAMDALINEFFEKFVYLVKVEHVAIENAIENCLKNQLNSKFNPNYFTNLQSKITDWILDKDKFKEPITQKFVQDSCDSVELSINSFVLKSRVEEKFNDHIVEFSFLESDSSSDLFDTNRPAILITQQDEVFLTCLKIYQKFRRSDKSMLYLSTNDPIEIIEITTRVFEGKVDYCLLEASERLNNSFDGIVDISSDPLKKLIVVTSDINNCRILKDHVPADIPNLTWSDLTNNSQQMILGKLINFQGNKIQLKDLINDFDGIAFVSKILELNNIHEIQLNESNFDQNLYIPRIIKRNLSLKVDLLEDVKNNKLKDTITFNESEFNKMCQQFPDTNIHLISMHGDNNDTLIEDNSLQSSFGGPNLKWMKTHNKLSNLIKYIDEKSSDEFSENQLLEFDFRICILADTAGMGKSQLFESLASNLRDKYPNSWVFKIDLNNFTSQFEKFSESKIWEFVKIDLLKFSNELEAKLFEYACLTESGNDVFLFFDGFDEIARDYRKPVLFIIQHFSTNTNAKIFISTRPEWKQDLEDQFSVISYTLVPFNKNNQKTYFKSFWKKFDKFKDAEIDQIIDSILEVSTSCITESDLNLTGIPLITKLLADYFENILKSLESKLKTALEIIATLKSEKYNLYVLYKAFVEKLIQRQLEVKQGIDISKPRNKRKFEKDLKNLNEMHGTFAIHQIFNDSLLQLLPEDLVRTLDDDELEELQDYGIINKCGDQYTFMHYTFIEFFATVLLTNHFQDLIPFICKVIFSQKGFQFMRLLINHFLQTESSSNLNPAKLKIPNEIFTELSSETNSMFPFHTVAKEGNGKSFEFLMESLLQQDEKTIKNILMAVDSEGSLMFFSYFNRCSDDAFNILDKIKDATDLKFIREILQFSNKFGGLAANILIASVWHGKNYPNVCKWILNNFENDLPFLKLIFASVDQDGDGIIHNAIDQFNSEIFLKFTEILQDMKLILGMEFIQQLIQHKNLADKSILYVMDFHKEINFPQILDWLRVEIDDRQIFKDFLLKKDSKGFTFLHNIFTRCPRKRIFKYFVEICTWINQELDTNALKELLIMKEQIDQTFLSYITFNDAENQAPAILIQLLDWISEFPTLGLDFLKEMLLSDDLHHYSILHVLMRIGGPNKPSKFIQTACELLKWMIRYFPQQDIVGLLKATNNDQRNFLFLIVENFDKPNKVFEELMEVLVNDLQVDQITLRELVTQKDKKGCDLLNFCAWRSEPESLFDSITEIISWIDQNLGSETVQETLRSTDNKGENFVMHLCSNCDIQSELFAILNWLILNNKIDQNTMKQFIFLQTKIPKNILQKYVAFLKLGNLANHLTEFLDWTERQFGWETLNKLLTMRSNRGNTFLNYLAINKDCEDIDSFIKILNALKDYYNLKKMDSMFPELIFAINLDNQTILQNFCENNPKLSENFVIKFLEWLLKNFDEDSVKNLILNRNNSGRNFLDMINSNKDNDEIVVSILAFLNSKFDESFLDQLKSGISE